MNKYALITGASKGIGRSMALLLAKAGYHILLVARSAAELQELVQRAQPLQEEDFQPVLLSASPLQAVEAELRQVVLWASPLQSA